MSDHSPVLKGNSPVPKGNPPVPKGKVRLTCGVGQVVLPLRGKVRVRVRVEAYLHYRAGRTALTAGGTQGGGVR